MKRLFTYLLFVFLFFSCNGDKLSEGGGDTSFIQPIDSNLPDVEFPKSIYPLEDTSAIIEIKMAGDSPRYFFNEKIVKEDSLLFIFNDWRLALSKRELSGLVPVLKIEKNVPIHYVERLKLGLRFMSQLRIAFINKEGELLLVKLPNYFPYKTVKPLPSTVAATPPPPPPPPVKKRVEMCSYEDGKFEGKGHFFTTLKECLEGTKTNILYVSLTEESLSINKKTFKTEELTKLLLELTSDFNEKRQNSLVVSFDYDDSITFGQYLDVFSKIQLYFAELWNIKAKEMFGKEYVDLNVSDFKTVRGGIPMVIPQNYNKK